ncbi:unnamed protein product [Sphagnum troendelagicum]|uniref:Uncharacterized protein n=1 Tax=Sphagnum troendelagicum TaxID=128251 RepID=A0ABP0TDC8_9BRYO
MLQQNVSSAKWDVVRCTVAAPEAGPSHCSSSSIDAELLDGGFAAAAMILGGARIVAASSFAAGGASSTARSYNGKSVELRS